jgi:hypothetical protein
MWRKEYSFFLEKKERKEENSWIENGMPKWRSPSWIDSEHVPQESMDDSGRPRVEHVQEHFKAYELSSPIY